MSKVNTLPTELILEIITQLRTKSQSDYTKALKNLRLVNWHFYSIMTPMLFTSITINIHERTSLLDYAKSLLSLTTVSGHIRRINVHCVDQSTYYKFAPALHRASSVLLGRAAYLQPLTTHKAWGRSLGTIGAHLRSLTSVSITSLRLSASLSGFWNTFRKEKIHIKELHVQYRIEPELLDYLASYSGLERLIIKDACPPGFISRWDVADQRLAVKFAKQVIPKHAQSLVALHVQGHDEGWWSFGRHNVLCYEQCAELREWGISINSEDVGSNSINLHRDVISASQSTLPGIHSTVEYMIKETITFSMKNIPLR
ncbi:hypothetical protein VNI00_013071 [Paramarasmius palmivorus]|uniref:F-box domain-containing protein n=1 Tax=Paramarasmius palmivorus TaxID=297713 RepID=A0AAW0C3L3_9AGAR